MDSFDLDELLKNQYARSRLSQNKRNAMLEIMVEQLVQQSVCSVVEKPGKQNLGEKKLTQREHLVNRFGEYDESPRGMRLCQKLSTVVALLLLLTLISIGFFQGKNESFPKERFFNNSCFLIAQYSKKIEAWWTLSLERRCGFY